MFLKCWSGQAFRQGVGNDTEISSPKIQKIDGANYKLDAIVTKRRRGIVRRLEAPWKNTHNANPGGKK